MEETTIPVKFIVGIVGPIATGMVIADRAEFYTEECAKKYIDVLRGIGLYANCAFTLVEVGE